MSNNINSSLMLSTNDYKLAALNLMGTFRVLADSQAPPVGAAAARRAEKKAQKKLIKIVLA